MANYYYNTSTTYTITSTTGTPYTVNVGAGGSGGIGSGSIFYTTSGSNGTSIQSGLHVRGNAEFEGDITVKGRSLEKLLESIEDRLAILQDPDPAKLEKYKALKKAYEHYKLLEKLIGEE